MGRTGMITVGIAVQAETFSNAEWPSFPEPFNNTTTALHYNTDNTNINFPFNNSSQTYWKSGGSLLHPTKKNYSSSSPQAIRITFGYNKETNYPEILVNLDRGENEDKYLALKELCRGHITEEVDSSPDQITDLNLNLDSALAIKKRGGGQNNNHFQSYYFFGDLDNKMHSKGSIEPASQDAPVVPEVPKDDENESKNADLTSPPEPTASKTGTPPSSNESEKSSDTTGTSRKEKVKRIQKGKGSSERLGKSVSPTKSHVKDKDNMSFEKSKIPIIQSSATSSNTKGCDYYRQKLQEEGACMDFMHPCWTTTSYTSIQKTAGQKVVSKLAAQQKQLQEQAMAQRRRTEFVFHEDLGFCEIPDKFLPRKKPTRLEPLRDFPKCF